jgi:hypothetical protein
MSQPVIVFAMALLTSLPIVAIGVVGVVLSRSRLGQSQARARRLATAGFSLTALQALVGPTIRTYAAIQHVEINDQLAFARILTITNAAGYVLLLASLVLLLLAVLADREPTGSSRGAI